MGHHAISVLSLWSPFQGGDRPSFLVLVGQFFYETRWDECYAGVSICRSSVLPSSTNWATNTKIRTHCPAPIKPCYDRGKGGRFLGALTASDLILRQREDTEICPLIDQVEGKNVISNGVLCKKNSSASDKAYLLVALADLCDYILLVCHDDPSSGHLCFLCTLARVRQTYTDPEFLSLSSLTCKATMSVNAENRSL